MDPEIQKLIARLQPSLICQIGEGGEDPGLGDGGGGDAEGESENTPDPSGGDGQKTYSEAEVEKIKQQAWADARKKYGRKPEPKSKAENPAPTRNAEPSAAELLALRDDFDDATDGLTLSKKQKRRLRDMFFRERPEDPESWITEMVEDFGIGNTAAATTPSAPPKPTGPPASNPGTPGGARDPNKVTDPNTLTKDDIQRLKEEHGVHKANTIIRDMVMRYQGARG